MFQNNGSLGWTAVRYEKSCVALDLPYTNPSLADHSVLTGVWAQMLQNNGSLWLHVYFRPAGSALDPSDEGYDANGTFSRVHSACLRSLATPSRMLEIVYDCLTVRACLLRSGFRGQGQVLGFSLSTS